MQRGGKKGVKHSTTQMKLRGFTLSHIKSNLYDYCLVSSMHLNQISHATSTTLENRDIEDTLNRRTLKRTTWKMFSRLIRRRAYTTRQIDRAASCSIRKRKNKILDPRLITGWYDIRVNARISKYLEQRVLFQISVKFFLFPYRII